MHATAAAVFEPLDDAVLLQAPAPGKWSAAQCLEHLNAYSRFYLPAMEKAIRAAGPQQRRPAAVFKSGILGNYFTNMMQPRLEGTIGMRMQSPRSYRPETTLPAAEVVAAFIAHQHKIIQLLQQAAQVNLQAVKVPTTLGSWLKFSLGDTFRFILAHEQRHLLQARRALAAETTGRLALE